MTNLYIKNFRNIGEEGATITLAPVTFLTGCNSAGKSSAAKAFLMLESFLSSVKANNGNIVDTPLDFSKVVKLGTFDTVINAKSRAKGVDYIVIGYDWEPFFVTKKIRVDFTFSKRHNDPLNQGWLNEFTIYIGQNALLTISVIDNHLSLKIVDKEKFAEYYRYYMIKQISAAYKDSLVIKSYYEDVVYEDVVRDEKFAFAQKILSLDLDNLLQLEKKLQDLGILKREMPDRAWDKTMIEGITQATVRGIVENAIAFDSLDEIIYSHEIKNNSRVSEKDISNIFDEAAYSNKTLQRLLNLYGEDNMHVQRFRNNIVSYVQSDAPNIIAYVQSRNGEEISNIEDVINYSWEQSQSVSIETLYWDRIESFIEKLISISMNPLFNDRMSYADASTVEVKRLYPLDLSDKFGNLWKQFNSRIPDSKFYCKHYGQIPQSDQGIRNDDYHRGVFMRKWLKYFNICDDIVVDNIEGALCVKLITKDLPDGRLLADYGYGITQLVALLLQIEIAINRVYYFHCNFVGEYELEGWLEPYPYYLILEEPEVHLHPLLQSKLADMFLDASTYGVNIIAETHSEYMIRRSQVIVAEAFSKKADYTPRFKVYYFPSNGASYDMGYQKNGKFVENFGSGFFDVADNQAIDLFEFDID